MESNDILGALRHECAPRLNSRQPYWAPNMPSTFYNLGTLIPEWNWKDGRTHANTVTTDKNGAWFSAASSVILPHGVLENTGDIPFNRDLAGYWLIEVDPWAHKDKLVSPLGNRKHPQSFWVTTPTLILLDELTDQDVWTGYKIHGSWTTTKTVRLNNRTDGGGWANKMRDHRTAILDGLWKQGMSSDQIHHHSTYEGFKRAYAKAWETIATGNNSPGGERGHRIYRPDWFHTMKAHHAANMWRSAWKCHQRGFSPVAMGAVDELTFRLSDWEAMEAPNTTSPLKIDQSGKALGHFKIKKVSE